MTAAAAELLPTGPRSATRGAKRRDQAFSLRRLAKTLDHAVGVRVVGVRSVGALVSVPAAEGDVIDVAAARR